MATRFKGPIKNASGSGMGDRAWFKDLNLGLDPDLVVWKNDFIQASDLDASNDWTATQVDAATDALAVLALAADALNGELTVTPNDADDDSTALQLNNEFVKLSNGKKVWFEAMVKVDDADDCDLRVGLAVNDTTPLDASDYLYFQLTDASASLSFVSAQASTSTLSAIATVEDDVYIKLGFRWDGDNTVEVFVNRRKVGEISDVANISEDEQLAPTLFIRNGSAEARTLTVDYIFVAQER